MRARHPRPASPCAPRTRPGTPPTCQGGARGYLAAPEGEEQTTQSPAAPTPCALAHGHLRRPPPNTRASVPGTHGAQPGVPPTTWTDAGGSSARETGRLRPNLGLPRSRLAPDCTSARARAATPAPARGGAGRCRKAGQVQAHRKGRSPCGKGPPVNRPESTGTLQGPAGQRGATRSDRSGRAHRPRELAGAPSCPAGGPWGYLGLAQGARAHLARVSAPRNVREPAENGGSNSSHSTLERSLSGNKYFSFKNAF